MRKYADLPYLADGLKEHLLDVYLPDGEGREYPVFLFFHGGGLTGGGKGIPGAPELTARGIACASAAYRLYPRASYPDFVNDAADAVDALMHRMGDVIRPTAIYIGGASAGAYLSMMLCFATQFLRARGIEPGEISGYFHDAGQPTVHFNVLKERGVDPRRVIVDEAAPLYYVGTEETYPPMMILTSDKDMENRPEQLELLISTLRHFRIDPSLYTFYQYEGTHCQIDVMQNEKGENLFGLKVAEFIHATEEKKKNDQAGA